MLLRHRANIFVTVLRSAEDNKDMPGDCLPEDHSDAVARGTTDRTVEIQIAAQGCLDVAAPGSRFHSSDDGMQLGCAGLSPAPVRHGITQQDSFQHEPQLKNLGHHGRIEDRYAIAASATAENALGMQYLQRFPRRDPAGAQLVSQGRLHHAVTRLEAVHRNGFSHGIGNDVWQG